MTPPSLSIGHARAHTSPARPARHITHSGLPPHTHARTHARCYPTRAALLLEGHPKILLVHELDDQSGGCEFSRFFDTTPRDLVVDGIYKTLATALAPGMHRAVSIALIAKAMGARNPSQWATKGKGGSVMQAIETDKKEGGSGNLKKELLARAGTSKNLLQASGSKATGDA